MTGPYYTVESLQPECSVGFLIKRCGILMSQIAERGFESQPISFIQWTILIWLTQRTHVSPTELSVHLGHDMGALTRLVDELERKHLVIRERSVQDRRAVQIAITPEGRRLAQVGKRVVLDLLNKLVEPYSRTEIDTFISLLQQFLGRMQEFAKAITPAEIPAESPGTPSRLPAKRAGTRARDKASRSTHKSPRAKTLE